MALNGKGEIPKIADVGGGVVVMVTALPARHGAQQPENLAVSKGTSCGLYPLGLCLRHPDGHLQKISTTGAAKAAPLTMPP